MKERPILFSGEMVRAILAGRKTQTRRVCNWQPQENASILHFIQSMTSRCKYGKPYDLLWVKETWKPHCEGEISPEFPLGTCIKYRADGACVKPENWTTEQGQWCEAQEESKNWKPSIFMPRYASRITLEIVAVRVERLNAISEADAISEGITPEPEPSWPAEFNSGAAWLYSRLWESINGVGSWSLNPWVWVIEFKKL